MMLTSPLLSSTSMLFIPLIQPASFWNSVSPSVGNILASSRTFVSLPSTSTFRPSVGKVSPGKNAVWAARSMLRLSRGECLVTQTTSLFSWSTNTSVKPSLANLLCNEMRAFLAATIPPAPSCLICSQPAYGLSSSTT